MKFQMILGLIVGALVSLPATAGTLLDPAGTPALCTALSARYPGPLPDKIGISANYAENYQSDFDNAMHAYAVYLTALSAQAVVSDKAAQSLHDEIVANAQRRPIDYNAKDEAPPIFHVLLVMVPQAIAYAQHHDSYSAEEQALVDDWLRDTIKKLQSDYALTKFKLDNKQYLFGVLIAATGHATGDTKLIDKAAKIYKTAIKGQRADGSLPRDSGRGGSALHYSNQAVGNLVALAELLGSAGIDAYGFESKGRSLHTIITFLLDATENPALIAGYADDPETRDASFPRTSPTNQDRSWPQHSVASWGYYYMARFPDTANAQRLLALSPFLKNRQIGEPDGPYGLARCYTG